MKRYEEMNRVLFLCSGNYYRSRFAEIFFNYLNEKSGNAVKWKALSRGLFVYKSNNPGPLSIHTRRALSQLSIDMEEPIRYPLQVRDYDMDNAAVVIAMKKAEHQDNLIENYKMHHDKIIYWDIHDLDAGEPEDTILAIKEHVGRLYQDICADRLNVRA